MDSVEVAYLGGVDRTLLLAMCADRLGADRVVALTVASATIPALEVTRASKLAERLGVRHRVVEMDMLKHPDVTANRPARRYH